MNGYLCSDFINIKKRSKARSFTFFTEIVCFSARSALMLGEIPYLHKKQFLVRTPVDSLFHLFLMFYPDYFAAQA